MPIVKLSCEYCKKNHTCKGAVINTEIKQVHVYKKPREQARKEKIERSKPVVKKEKIEFNVIS
jgi:deoxycytidylate deaminase